MDGVIESYELGFRMQGEVPELLDISKECGVKKFIYTSSAHVHFQKGHYQATNVDEEVPPATKYPNHYCRSKAEAEKVNVDRLC